MLAEEGAPSRADLQPSWLGYSTGRWDADSQIVETAGFNVVAILDRGVHPRSEATRLIERFRRRDFRH